MKKYIKGKVVKPCGVGYKWEAQIDCNESQAHFWESKIVVHESTEKEVKRLRKKIMKALNKPNDKKPFDDKEMNRLVALLNDPIRIWRG